ncbi:MAG: YraN family protein [Defluviitaleaceae bacterium]|nr:YraN family protein [Defluviitaleaceae bacterium]MCL2836765.1 YraN family protein [Defluviitaleaceae bacterium]
MRRFDGFDKGIYGETIAEGYLRAKGYEILKTRYRCPYGEIDLVARHGIVIVFIEVKLRKTPNTGLAAESVTLKKQRRIIHSALHYIGANTNPCETYRFDVLEVYGREFYTVRHIENAFYADG